jgi:hypothetical protein
VSWHPPFDWRWRAAVTTEPDVREFCGVLVGSGKKRFDFALLAAGYDTGGKSARAVLGVRSPGRACRPKAF